MKVNFNGIAFMNVEGVETKGAVASELGNVMYMQGQNIEECELGKTIYMDGKAGNATELNDEAVNIVKKYIQGYPYIIRKAIEDAMK